MIMEQEDQQTIWYNQVYKAYTTPPRWRDVSTQSSPGVRGIG